MKPEEKAEIIIWDWLKNKSSHIEEIYFNRKNKINAPTFQVKGIAKKPDMLIKMAFQKNGKHEHIAVEIKPSETSKDIRKGIKILDYYENYVTGKTKYLIDNKEIAIRHFAIATTESPKGHLFKDEKEFKDHAENDKKIPLIAYRIIPRYEFTRTKEMKRHIDEDFRRLREKLKEAKKLPSTGIIIAEPKGINKPHYFCIIHVDWMNKKHRWGQRFMEM